MQIGLITGEYPPMQGGVGDFGRELGQTLVELGHEVHVITGKSQIANPPRVLVAGRKSFFSTA